VAGRCINRKGGNKPFWRITIPALRYELAR